MLHAAIAAVVCVMSSLAHDPVPGAGFSAARTRVPVGAERAVCCTLAAPAGAETLLHLESSDAGIARVERQPVFLAGSVLAFARVRGVAPGSCELRGEGMTPLAVEVVTAAGKAQPRVISPAPGAVVWGAVDAGVTFTDLEGESRAGAGNLTLRLSDGRELAPVADDVGVAAPVRRAVFRVETGAVNGAALTMEPVWTSAAGERRVGAGVGVRIARPGVGEAVVYEAESLAPVARPARFANAPNEGSIGKDEGASGGKFLNNPGAEPALCMGVKAERDGWYQVVLTARGTLAGGAYPSVGLVIDNNTTAATNTRLFDGAWRRVALGVPVRVSAGERVLTTWFDNDFYVEKMGDRNLQIDRAEVLRVPDDAAPAPTASNSSGMPMMVSGSAPAGVSAGAGTDVWGLEPRAVRVAFQRTLDGLPLGGELLVEGLCWWEGEGVRAPRVELLVNGKVASVQRSGVPRFLVDPSGLSGLSGETCTLQMVATLDSGAQDRTAVQTMRLRTSAGAGARRYLRYTVHDDAWEAGTNRSAATEKYPPERSAIVFMTNGEALLRLPEDLTGTFDVSVETLAQEFNGPPTARVELVAGGGRTAVGEITSHAWWVARPAGRVELKAGAKQLAVAFTNDAFEEGKGDRNLWVQGVVLQEAAPADASPPGARVVYPAPGARVGMVDALVAEFGDDRGVQRVELLVDGAPTGVSKDVTGKPGRVLLPVILRGVGDGRHTLGVRVTDAAGASAETPAVPVELAAALGGELGSYDRAVRVLNRMGFGPEPSELAAVLVEGDAAWLRRSLKAAPNAGDLSAMGFACTRFGGARSEYEVMRRPLTHAMMTPNSVRARFVLWTKNHFSTWIRKAEPDRAWAEYATFAQLGTAPFFDLLMASATSASMLRYLDQEQSYAGRLNENYAREIMELHTLGVHGGYTQGDVTTLARVLTGWTTAREGDGAAPGELRGFGFVFDPTLTDPAPADFLGMRFPEAALGARYDRARAAIEVLAAHPATGRFVCAKLASHYVSDPAPTELVDALVARFNETGGDMAEVMLAMAQHPLFMRRDLEDRLAHPVEFGIRVLRTTGHMQAWLLGDFLQRCSSGLFDRSTPDGYPEEDSAYIDTNAMAQRWRFAKDNEYALVGLVPDGLRYGDMPADAGAAGAWAQRVVDHLAVGLTGRVLGEASNAAAVRLVLAGEGLKQDRVLRVAPFVAQLPEASLR